MRRALYIATPLLLIALLIHFYAPARLAAIVLAGRGSVCSLDQALEAPANLRLQTQIKDRILAASKKLETDQAGFELWDTPKGRFWIPAGSHYVLPFNLAEQERDIYSLGRVRIHPGDVVLDCGANVGVFTRRALEQGAGLVVAIEPAPENIECLRRNFQSEIAAGKVIVYPKGVWDKDDFLTLHVDPHNSAADSFLIERPGSHTEEKVPLTTIDKLSAELNLKTVDFIKMDIEGAEVRAIHGGRATIARFHPRLAISAYHDEDHPVEVPKAVRSAWDGYTMLCGPCAEAGWRLRPDILLFH
ncbi:MAG: FkbM family methyltransferase [Acidimicrobiia bacterium]|nr:FkbM family methyltransferase [Acidimicrobiia bacterium]